jgi:hypothetical protein
MPEGLEMAGISEFAAQYSGSGKNNLIDGLKGSTDFRLGGWQGFEGRNLEAIVRIMHDKPLRMLSIGCFQDINSWIFMPSDIELWTSSDGIKYVKAGTLKNDFPADKWGTFTKEFTFAGLNITDRFVKVIAVNSGPCPAWHPGSGNPTWIFADEINFGF